MILEFLSFLPMIHERAKGGKVIRIKSDTITDSFSSENTFWEQIKATRDYKVKQGDEVPNVVPFRNDKGKLKTMVVSEDEIDFMLSYEKDNPSNYDRWIWEKFKNFIDKPYYVGVGVSKVFTVYNHDGEVVRKTAFKINILGDVIKYDTTNPNYFDNGKYFSTEPKVMMTMEKLKEILEKNIKY